MNEWMNEWIHGSSTDPQSSRKSAVLPTGCYFSKKKKIVYNLQAQVWVPTGLF